MTTLVEPSGVAAASDCVCDNSSQFSCSCYDGPCYANSCYALCNSLSCGIVRFNKTKQEND